ncbi:tannase/feruloyl esterase family alpha/beta hydrolase [Alteraurantiacibacter aquimixticola]|uniref:Tannase/feruloyl esterase family alpha/beta hydrolase n=1 Tax=Alteraurantiacibacter aquimixticola TaxID=2489173 RepID=A0A4T3F9K2_9SPHN|nr:tannase/feruloyl esterase family alpha/beta hydrolase [Alteraurantiacibacter aquimixticola]TIX51700.1 tannase/feruloyl esterase family alpha/beta hydrolase [Alteraurantiacibacter aquimixticola]
MTGTKTLIALSAMAAALAAPSTVAAHEASGDARSAEDCSALSGLRLDDAVIESAELVPAQDDQRSLMGDTPGYPAFCRVVARVRSAPDSDIGVEIWLPLQGWEGVFHGNGSGGFAGTFTTGYSGMADGLRRGFATATTDAGTAPASPLEGDALIGSPRKWRDWGRLSTNVMTETGKAITRAFYGREAGRSYYTGCSTGGQQGLIEAMFYPDDYDGILVGAPVIHRTWGHAAVLWDYAAAHRTPGSFLSDTKLKLLNRAAISTCWAQGHALAGDSFISDPMACDFDPGVLQCQAGASDSCLTDEEVATARAFYSGPTNADGSPAYYGWLPGSEVPGLFGWSFLQTPINDQPPFSGLFKWVHGASWDWRNFDFHRNMPLVHDRLGPIVNDATRGSLGEFAARGRKLMIYHGLADTLVAPGQSVDFFNRQTAGIGEAAMAESARLYLAPGVMHCGGGTGPDAFNATLGIPPLPPSDDPRHDMFSALIAWTERGEAPEEIIATRFSTADPSEIEMQRPLCPYPKQARYRGVGSTLAPASFECR